MTRLYAVPGPPLPPRDANVGRVHLRSQRSGRAICYAGRVRLANQLTDDPKAVTCGNCMRKGMQHGWIKRGGR